MKRIAVLILVAVGVWGAVIVVRHHTTHTPGAPHIGDSCTNNSNGTFSYNDDGPGYVEQTAFGLTCQGPAPAALPAPVTTDTTTPAAGATTAAPTGPPLPIAGDGVVSCIDAQCHQAGHETVWPMPDACDHNATWTAAGTDRQTGAALYRCKANTG